MISRTILLVEDNSNDELLALMAFKKHHVSSDIIVARDGVEAIEYFFGRQPGYEMPRLPSVVFLDLKLPRLDGLEVLQRLRADERTRLVPVVMLTSSSEESDISRSYALGANSYVCKPVDFDEYTEAIGQIGLYWTTMNQGLV